MRSLPEAVGFAAGHSLPAPILNLLHYAQAGPRVDSSCMPMHDHGQGWQCCKSAFETARAVC